MKEGWEVKKLGEVCETITKGTTPKTIGFNYTDFGINFIKVESISESGCFLVDNLAHVSDDCHNALLRSQLKERDLLFSIAGALGRTAIVDKSILPANTNQALAIIRLKDKSDLFLRFLQCYFRSLKVKNYIDSIKVGVAQMNLSLGQLKDFPIIIPPIPEQSRIVEELALLSNIIEKKRQQLSELDNLAQSIFYDMFGDPVTNEKGWEVKTIGDIVLSVNYGTSSPASEDGKYKYLRMNNLTYSGFLDLKDLKTITIGEKEYEKYVVRKGDILFNRTNSKDLVGKTALFDLDEEMIIAGYIIRVRTNSQMVLPIYVVKHMNTPYIKQYLANLCKGAVNQANINTKELQKIPICIPPLSLQQLFAQKIEAIQKQKELIKQSIAETEELFNSRMDYYFN